MRFILAILLPPVAILLCGRPLLAVLSIPLCVLFWIPGVALAIYVVMQRDADRRSEKLAAAIRNK